MAKPGTFYLGSTVAENSDAARLDYDSSQLTTHGVIVGMTGSGKTGLGVVLLEEAARAGVPCIVIDPKGDMTNLALNFLGKNASAFNPWVDKAEAERQGLTTDQLGAALFQRWRSSATQAGFSWEDPSLALGSRFEILTPGSKRGRPVNLIGSLACPHAVSDGDDFADEIDSVVSGLLGLMSIEADPLTSRPYLLLSGLIAHAWSKNANLDLERLITEVIDPPFRKLGVFQVEAFFPKDERTKLALQLNNLLASPAFSAWCSGVPLDIDALLNADTPKSTIVYLAHLSEAERQFVVALLLGKVVSWVRRQPGTSALRALVYMDEVAGYVPPSANPATKKPILTLLKQARAQGLGLLLATQNPVDLDYKVLSNAATWLIGRLQTPQDRKRLLTGLSEQTFDGDTLDAAVAKLSGRQFVLHRAGKPPTVFGTRAALSYLRGPLTLKEVVTLCATDAPSPSAAATGANTAVPSTGEAAGTAAVVNKAQALSVAVAPAIAKGIPVSYLRSDAPWVANVGANFESAVLHPALAARVQLKFDETAADLDLDLEWEAVLFPLSEPPWDPRAATQVDYDDRDFSDQPAKGAVYSAETPNLSTLAHFKRFETQLKDELLRTQVQRLKTCVPLELYARPGESDSAFKARCSQAATERAEAEAVKLHSNVESKLAKLRAKQTKEEQRVSQLEQEKSSRTQNELVSAAAGVLKLFFGGRGGMGAITGAVSRRNQTRATSQRLDSARENQSTTLSDMEQLENELSEQLSAIQERWQNAATQLSDFEVKLEKTDIRVSELRVVWIPS